VYGDVFTIDLSAGQMKVTETYQVTVQGHMMVISIDLLRPDAGIKAADRDKAPP
jgi:hypothetical protein